MKKYSLSNFVRGWIVGNFSPSIYTKDYELGVRRYSMGDSERSHCHMMSDEVTIIITGHVKINGCDYFDGDIVIQEKGDYADFICLSDTAITCVYRPDRSCPEDKIFKT